MTKSELFKATEAFASSGFRRLSDDLWQPHLDETGNPTPGIRGKIGLTLPGVPAAAELIELQAGVSFPRHSHDYAHAIYVVEGCCGIEIEGDKKILDPGAVVYIPPHSKHSFKAFEQRTLVMGVGHSLPKRNRWNLSMTNRKLPWMRPIEWITLIAIILILSAIFWPLFQEAARRASIPTRPSTSSSPIRQ